MALYHILVLAVVQGLTEFLPISSSGHLVLTSRVLGWDDQGVAIDIAVHVGTLLAVMIYFWRDVGRVMAGTLRLATFRSGPDARLAIMLLIATLPIVIVGFLAKDLVETVFRSVELIAWATIGFALLLWLADRLGMTVNRIEHVGAVGALLIGLSQVLALIPGTSRSGITMTAGRFLGMERAEAARFSMLLSIPTIIGAAVLKGVEVWQAGNVALGYDAAIAIGLSFVAGIASIAVLMRWLQTSSFGPFVIYRIALGILLLWWVYIIGLPMPGAAS
ncbi:MAG: undecaprenyl-diphosphate phosphatase [Proteobacteria bacterium]|nr:undecaprenyl-diphosphate phosphatase [Pseudomonadota bacterium]